MDFDLTLSEDKLNASLEITSSKGFSKLDLIDRLKDHNVIFGLDEDVLNEIVENPSIGKTYIVANGEDVQEGTEGSIEYLYEKVNLNSKDGSRIDHYHLSSKTFATEGMILAKRIPSIQGCPGKNVLGEVIEPVELPEVNLPIGLNVIQDQKDSNICIAASSGVIEKSNDGSLNINPIFEVKNHVDFSIGHINFDGNVTINGDVKANFKVVASKDIEIKGAVEDAIIEAGGDISCKQGFVGYNSGEMNAGGDIFVNHVVSQTVAARKNLYINSEAVDSMLICGGSLLSEKGRIIGGEVMCKGQIIVNQLGNENNQHTKIKVGINTLIEREIERLKEKINEQSTKKNQFMNEIKKFDLIQSRGNALGKDVNEIYNKYKIAVDVLDLNINKYEQEIKELNGEDDGELLPPVLTVLGIIYSNVTIQMKSGSFKTTQRMSGVKFYLNASGEVVYSSLS